MERVINLIDIELTALTKQYASLTEELQAVTDHMQELESNREELTKPKPKKRAKPKAKAKAEPVKAVEPVPDDSNHNPDNVSWRVDIKNRAQMNEWIQETIKEKGGWPISEKALMPDYLQDMFDQEMQRATYYRDGDLIKMPPQSEPLEVPAPEPKPGGMTIQDAKTHVLDVIEKESQFILHNELPTTIVDAVELLIKEKVLYLETPQLAKKVEPKRGSDFDFDPFA